MDNSGKRGSPQTLPPASPPQKHSLPESLVQISGIALHFLASRLEDLFDTLDDALFSMAEHTSSSEDQRVYFDALSYLRRHRRDFIQDYVARFDDQFPVFPEGYPEVEKTEEKKNSELNLDDSENPDVRLAFENTARRFNRKFVPCQNHLVGQFDLLLHESGMNIGAVPFFPDDLCRNFQYAMGQLELDVRVSLMLWKHFGSDVLAGLPTLYEKISRLLAESGHGSVYRNIEAPQVANSDDRLINFVSLLFEYIIDDHLLPAAVRALLSRLQIPVLKLAQIDELFFRQRSHPARRLLNGLAAVGMELSDEAIERGDPVFTRMENIVDRLLTNFDDDPGIFNVIFQDFEDNVPSLLASAQEKKQHRSKPVKQGKFHQQHKPSFQPVKSKKRRPKQAVVKDEGKLSGKQLQEKMTAEATEEIVLQTPHDSRPYWSNIKPREKIKTENLEHQLQQVAKLRKGQLVEFIGEKGGSLQCRLTFISKKDDHYGFENTQGMKVVDKSADELAQEIHDGTLKILEDDLLFDKAFQSVLGNFKFR